MIVFFILAIFLGYFVKIKSKRFELLIILLCGALIYFGHDIPDFASYENAYIYIESGVHYTDTGIGWLWISRIGNYFGLTYREFATTIYVLSAILVRYSLNEYITNFKCRRFVWSLYLIFPALLDCVQIRFWVAQAIFFFALKFLFQKKLKGYLLYLLLILIASTIHSSSLFYLLFLLMPFFEKIKNALAYVVLILSIVLLFFKNNIVSLIGLVINQHRVERYFQSNDGTGLYGFIAYVFILALFSLISKRSLKCLNSSISTKQKSYIQNVYKISVLMWLLLPLSTFDTNIFRLQRPLWILIYVLLFMMYENGQKNLKLFKNLSVSIKTLGFTVSLIGMVFFILVFTYNVFLGFLL